MRVERKQRGAAFFNQIAIPMPRASQFSAFVGQFSVGIRFHIVYRSLSMYTLDHLLRNTIIPNRVYEINELVSMKLLKKKKRFDIDVSCMYDSLITFIGVCKVHTSSDKHLRTISNDVLIRTRVLIAVRPYLLIVSAVKIFFNVLRARNAKI